MPTEPRLMKTPLAERTAQLRDDEALAQQHSPRASKDSVVRGRSSQETSSTTLRKSFSVDSFVRSSDTPMSRPSPGGATAMGVMSGRPHALSVVSPPSTGILREADELLEGRGRGSSLSSIVSAVSTESRVRGEPDADLSARYDKGPSLGHSKASFTLPSIPPMPPISQNKGRLHSLSTSSSLASTVSAHSTSSSRISDSSYPSSTQSPTRGKTPGAARSRSGSLVNPPPPPPPRRLNAALSLPTQLPQPRLSSPITLIVVGVAGCGKSVVIRKGLKGYKMSDPSASLPGTPPIKRYSRRTGRTQEHDVPLNVFEVDIEPDAFGEDAIINTQQFLPETPRVDGVLICYDASSSSSFQPVESLLRGYLAIRTPTVVLACKSDLPKEIDPQNSLEVLQQYDVGLVEVTNAEDSGREKMKRSMNWLLRAVNRARMSQKQDEYRNPASPDLIKSNSNPWDSPASATSSTTTHLSSVMASIPSSPPREVISPTRVRSTGDLTEQHEQDIPPVQDQLARSSPLLKRSTSVDSFRNNASTPTAKPSVTAEIQEEQEIVEDKPQQLRRGGASAQWASLDELLDKLVFLAVSGDDSTFITHFLLTYRRFTTPRTVLLSMQKKMRLLDSPSNDPMFACFAQMRICYLLETWIHNHRYDFAVKGTAGALSALVKSILSKTYLLHYANSLLPFLEQLPSLVDRDAPWSYKEENGVGEESSDDDDSYSFVEDPTTTTTLGSVDEHDGLETDPGSSALSLPEKKLQTQRERKGSLPLTAKAILQQSSANSSSNAADAVLGKGSELSTKELLRHLQRIAAELNTVEPEEIAQEITRWESELFLAIEPRHWLAFTLTSGKKNAEDCPVTRFNELSNRLGAWVVSLILCHDRPKARSRQLEKFVEVAQKLRAQNNYSALRAFVAGINRSTFNGDPTMEQFRARCPDAAKTFQSWEMLLQQIRAHRAYRLALRNSKGACIPALEVHMSDLIRSHEGNPDTLEGDPSKIRWGKYSMMGRFVSTIMQCQAQCIATKDYSFVPRNDIKRMLETPYLMNEDMQQSRITPFEAIDPMDDPTRPLPTGPNMPRPSGGGASTGSSTGLAPGIKKLFLW